MMSQYVFFFSISSFLLQASDSFEFFGVFLSLLRAFSSTTFLDFFFEIFLTVD
jgi:hypothetical protein